MGVVIQLKNAETLEQFIRRAGPVTTAEIAQRFRWDHRKTFERLSQMEQAGIVVSKVQSVSHIGRGTMARLWSVTKKS